MLGFECFPHRCGYGRYRFNLPSQEKKITIEYVELCFLTVSGNDWVVLELLLHALGSRRGKDFVLETAPGCLLPPAGRRHRAPAGGWDEGPGPRSAVARCLRSPGARPGRGRPRYLCRNHRPAAPGPPARPSSRRAGRLRRGGRHGGGGAGRCGAVLYALVQARYAHAGWGWGWGRGGGGGRSGSVTGVCALLQT